MKIAQTSTEGIAPQSTLDRLKRLYGAAWTLTERGSVGSINPRWWAGLFHIENSAIFCQREGFFLFDALEGVYVPASPDSVRERIAKRFLVLARDLGIAGLEKQAKVAVLGSILLYLRGIAEVRDPFDGIKGVLAVENGVLVFNRGKVRFEPFSSKYRVRDRIPVHYDPKAICSTYDEEFIGAVLGPDDVDLLHRQAGLTIAGDNPSQRLGILEGAAGSGKSTFLGILTVFNGISRTVQLRTEHLDQPFEMSAFHGRTLLTAADVDSDFLSTRGAHTLKGLVSADLFYPEAKNSNERKPLRGPFCVLIGTNCKLTYRSQGDGAAWRRRLILYEWQEPPADRRKVIDYGGKLIAEEGSGILNRFLDGYRTAWKELEAGGDLVLTDEQRDRVESLVMRSEALETFIKTRLEADPDFDLTSAAVMAGFLAWCNAMGWAPPKKERQIQIRIAELILEHWGQTNAHSVKGPDGKQVRGWWGTARTSFLFHARGIEHHSNGVQNSLGTINLVLASGRIGKPKSGYGTIVGQANGQGGREHGQKCDQLPGWRDISNPEHRQYIAGVWEIEERDLRPRRRCIRALPQDRCRRDQGVAVHLLQSQGVASRQHVRAALSRETRVLCRHRLLPQ